MQKHFNISTSIDGLNSRKKIQGSRGSKINIIPRGMQKMRKKSGFPRGKTFCKIHVKIDQNLWEKHLTSKAF